MPKTAKAKVPHAGIVSPIGTARFPKLAQVDELSGKYQVDLVLDESEMEILEARLTELAKGLDPNEKLKLPINTDKNGVRGFRWKSKKRPAIVDSKKNPIGDPSVVSGGAKVRISGSLAPYDGFGGGFTLYLNAVQVIAPGTSGGAAAFDAVDGYVAGDDDLF